MKKLFLLSLLVSFPIIAGQAHPHDMQIRKKVELTEKILADTYSNAKPFIPTLAIVTIALDMYQSAKNTLKLQLVIATLEESLTQLLTALAYHKPHQDTLRAYCKTAHEQTIVIEELIISELPAKERRQLMRTLRSVQKRVIPFAAPVAFAGAAKYIGALIAVAVTYMLVKKVYTSIVYTPVEEIIEEQCELLKGQQKQLNRQAKDIKRTFPKRTFYKKQNGCFSRAKQALTKDMPTKRRRADYKTPKKDWSSNRTWCEDDAFPNALNFFLYNRASCWSKTKSTATFKKHYRKDPYNPSE